MGILNDVRERIARMESKLDRLGSVEEKAEKADDTANEALLSSKSAHHRLDTHAKVGLALVGAFASAFIGAVFILIQGGG